MKLFISAIVWLLFISNSQAQSLNGEQLYQNHCASCHHSQRIGQSGPPLIPAFLKRIKVKALAGLIKDGFPQTQMPNFEHLDEASLVALAQYIKSPVDKNIKWDADDIDNSIITFDLPKKKLGIKDIKQVTPVVEREGGFVWIMEDEKILDKFPLKNIHGGIKYQFPKAHNIFIPTRDGWIEKYSLKQGRPIAKVRIGINLRNVSLSRDGKYVLATSLLPQQLSILDSKTLKTVRVIPLDGKVSAIYEFYSQDKAIFTYRDKPLVGILDTKTFELKYTTVAEPIEDFFIDPYDKFIIATARRGKLMRVYDLNNLEIVFEHEMGGMPHLFAATYWYKDGNFYFATPHLRKSFVTIWKMYDWSYEQQIDIGGDGFFVKTHPNTDYLWIDNGTDELTLINKDTFERKTLIPDEGKQYIHAEFSGDGKYTYLSIYQKEGSIQVLDTKSLELIKTYPADVPVGKYNYINKNRQFHPMLFGTDIFNEKCKDKKKPKRCMKKLKGLNQYEKTAVKDFMKVHY